MPPRLLSKLKTNHVNKMAYFLKDLHLHQKKKYQFCATLYWIFFFFCLLESVYILSFELLIFLYCFYTCSYLGLCDEEIEICS